MWCALLSNCVLVQCSLLAADVQLQLNNYITCVCVPIYVLTPALWQYWSYWQQLRHWLPQSTLHAGDGWLNQYIHISMFSQTIDNYDISTAGTTPPANLLSGDDHWIRIYWKVVLINSQIIVRPFTEENRPSRLRHSRIHSIDTLASGPIIQSVPFSIISCRASAADGRGTAGHWKHSVPTTHPQLPVSVHVFVAHAFSSDCIPNSSNL